MSDELDFDDAQPKTYSQTTGQKRRTLDQQLDDEDEPPKKIQKTVRYNSRIAKIWTFTINNPTDQMITNLISSPHISHYVFQEEDEGTPHLQGVLRLRKKHRMNWLKRHVDGGAHWEPCESLKGSILYCSKKAKRKRGGRLWTKGWKIREEKKKVRDPLEGKELYRYQEEIIDMVLGEPDLRKVYWYWSSRGNIGKSSLVKHLCLKFGAVCIGGKFSDALYAIAEREEAGKKCDILIFDIPRSQGNKISFTAIESVKNGCFFSSKYKSNMCLMNTPHIIIFANEEPRYGGLSADRWNIKCLDNEDDLPSEN